MKCRKMVEAVTQEEKDNGAKLKKLCGYLTARSDHEWLSRGSSLGLSQRVLRKVEERLDSLRIVFDSENYYAGVRVAQRRLSRIRPQKRTGETLMNNIKNHASTTLLFAGFLILFAGLLMLAVIERKCRPYTPHEECEPGKYELKLRSITRKDKPIIAYVEAGCVVKDGAKIVKARQAFFTTRGLTDGDDDYFNSLELPAVQTEICKWQD